MEHYIRPKLLLFEPNQNVSSILTCNLSQIVFSPNKLGLLQENKNGNKIIYQVFNLYL